MVWKEVSHSATGVIHQNEDVPCQDYAQCRVFDDVIVGAVADGAGSAKYADEGSRLAVWTVINWFQRIIESESDELSASWFQEQTKNVFTKIVKEVIEKFQGEAQEKHCQIRDLACTLIIFIANPQWLAAMQIGDGLIVVSCGNSQDYQLLFKPDKGEFINETTFVTCAHAVEEMKVKVISSPRFISVATDGLENVAIKLRDWQAFPPFFKTLETYLKTTPNPKEDRYLDNLLNCQQLNARTTDDKTLLLCMWEAS